jgi:hypothetical protein
MARVTEADRVLGVVVTAGVIWSRLTDLRHEEPPVDRFAALHQTMTDSG